MVAYSGVVARLVNFMRNNVIPSGSRNRVFAAWSFSGLSWPSIAVIQSNQSQSTWIGKRVSSTHVGSYNMATFTIHIVGSGASQRDKIFSTFESSIDTFKATLEKSGIFSIKITHAMDAPFDENQPTKFNRKIVRAEVDYISSGTA